MQIILSKREKQLITAALLCVLIQILTYLLFAHSNLAARIVGDIPLDSNTFVLLDPELRSRESRALLRALENELTSRGHSVLERNDQVPPDRRVYAETKAGERVIAGYIDGYKLSLSSNTWFPGVVYVAYGTYSGNRGVWGSSGVFVWFLGVWLRVWSGGTEMA